MLRLSLATALAFAWLAAVTVGPRVQPARAALVATGVPGAAALLQPKTGLQPKAGETAHEVGNDACRPCHTAIYDSYMRTAMARTSGPAAPGLEGTFQHAASGVSYRVWRDGQTPRLTYERDTVRDLGPALASQTGSDRARLQGSHALTYFIGSNTRGRTYLFEIDGYLYQSPINYYAGKQAWEMSPGFADAREMPLRPVDATCLFCHASRVRPTRTGTLNGFDGAAFLQNGVGCERCHGPGSEHVQRRGALVNPARLQGERRDAVCTQCHLEGEARIARAHRSQDDYAPGDLLSDYLTIFVREDHALRRRGAVSHVESLALSACKRQSDAAESGKTQGGKTQGGKTQNGKTQNGKTQNVKTLSCITCHDPHVQPAAAERPAYYRAKCLGCHESMAATHHPREPDCTTCHMPRLESADISHTAVTDHRIVRLRALSAQAAESAPSSPSASPGGAAAGAAAGSPTVSAGASPQAAVGRLIPFGTQPAEARDLGLAYGEVALRGDAAAGREAMRLLDAARQQHPDDRDPDVLTRLGYLHQANGDFARAEEDYAQALKADPDRAVAAANLGVFYARRGLLARSLELWRVAFTKNPQLSEIGINLARGTCAAGDISGARTVLQRVLAHNPDLDLARQTLAEIERTGCRKP